MLPHSRRLYLSLFQSILFNFAVNVKMENTLVLHNVGIELISSEKLSKLD